MSENTNLVEVIQNSGFQACIVVTGGGSGAVHALLSHPGASRFILDVRIPYSRESMQELLGSIPESYCSEQTARLMAGNAYHCASDFKVLSPIGISCTAALATNSERPGPERAFICFLSGDRVELHKIEFSALTRSEQEEELSSILIDKLHRFVC